MCGFTWTRSFLLLLMLMTFMGLLGLGYAEWNKKSDGAIYGGQKREFKKKFENEDDLSGELGEEEDIMEMFESEPLFTSFYSSRVFFRYRDNGNDIVSPLTLNSRIYFSLEYPTSFGNSKIAGDIYYKTNFSRSSPDIFSLNLREANLRKDYDKGKFGIGLGIISWGRTDISPIDVINPPDLRDFIFADAEALKVPILYVSGSLYVGSLLFEEKSKSLMSDLGMDVVFIPFYESAFLPSIFSEWSNVNLSGDKDKVEVLRSTLGNFRINVKSPSFPSSVQGGVSFYTSALSLYFFSGLEHIPSPQFEMGLSRVLASDPKSMSDKLKTLTVEELAEPVLSVSKPPMVMEPSRFFMFALSWGREFNGVSLKIDSAFFVGRKFLTENFELRKYPMLASNIQIEKFFGKHFFVLSFIPSVIFVDGSLPQRNYRFLGTRAVSINMLSNIISRWSNKFITFLTLLISPFDSWGYFLSFQVERSWKGIKIYPNFALFGNLVEGDSDIGSMKDKSFVGLWVKYYIF